MYGSSLWLGGSAGLVIGASGSLSFLTQWRIKHLCLLGISKATYYPQKAKATTPKKTLPLLRLCIALSQTTFVAFYTWRNSTPFTILPGKSDNEYVIIDLYFKSHKSNRLFLLGILINFDYFATYAFHKH